MNTSWVYIYCQPRPRSLDEAILAERFARLWRAAYPEPSDDEDVIGWMEYMRATRAAWRVARALNRAPRIRAGGRS